MLVNIYIDGFSFYYRALKDTPYKWLNPLALCQLLLPRDEIGRIKYFTAHIIPPPWDPQQHIRQQTYLRALRTVPRLDIVRGHFHTHQVRRPLADGSGMVDILAAEEKGSDVNLATHLVVDAAKGRLEAAAVLTNDTDLVCPIRMVQDVFGLPVGILCPTSRPSPALNKVAAFIKHIRAEALAASQFPPDLTDAVGAFSKPKTW